MQDLVNLRLNNPIFRLFGMVVVCALVFGLSSCGRQNSSFVSTIALPPPDELKFQNVEQGLMVSWPAVQGASKYTLFWGPEESDYRRIVETTSQAVIIKGLTRGQVNYFAVTASTPHVESRLSKETQHLYDSDMRHTATEVQEPVKKETKGNFMEALTHLVGAINQGADDGESSEDFLGPGSVPDEKSQTQKDFEDAKKLSAKSSLISVNKPDNPL